MEIGTIRQINIDAEMQASYLDYAMSVIVARALPDVRDGLKPVHRRILYAMHDLGLQHSKPYKKSARIVGEVLGKYHPHGDAAVYEAMVRMAQDFSLRYPLVDGQGNFGSIDGDNAAAMRYTEARLSAIAAEMLTDIEKDTVDWVPNFDGTLEEPSVLPGALPNLIVNGTSGIAVGMSTSIPPHNLGEVCDALCYLIDKYEHIEEVTIEDLMRFIPGPDFPTGGVVYRYGEQRSGGETEQVDMIAHAYAGGKGRIVVQAKAHIEEMTRSRSRIVVTELPYQTDKSNLIERIAELVRDGRLDGVTDLRDESDRTGMRLCIELTRSVGPRDVLAELFRLTPLQSTFSVSLLALVNGEPRLLSLKRILHHYIEHRQEVILRRSRHDLEKALLRAHILEGLLRALDMLDDVIATIRRSRTADTAKNNLIQQFKFTEIQAQAILDMQLRRLAALERRKLDEENRQILALIKELQELLDSPAKVLALIRSNLVDLKKRFGDPRRTQIADRTKGALTAKDVLPDQEVWVTMTAAGLLSRIARAGSKHPLLAGRERPIACLPSNTRQDLYLFSARGQATRIPVYQVPDGVGAHYADISGLTRRDRVTAICIFPQPQGDEASPGYLLMATERGKVKRASLIDVVAQAHTNPQVIGLDANDDLAWAGVSAGGGEFLLATERGQAIRFSEDDVRSMGLPAGGIGGIRLHAKDRVTSCCGIPAGTDPSALVALVTAQGFGKRVPLSEFPVQGRNGQGVIAAKSSPRAGQLAGAALVTADDLLACLTAGGAAEVLRVAQLPETGRASLGKAVLTLGSGEQVQAVYGASGLGAEPPPQAPTRSRKPRTGTRAKSAAATKAAVQAGARAKPAAAPARRRAAKTPETAAENAEPPAVSGGPALATRDAATGPTKPATAARKTPGTSPRSASAKRKTSTARAAKRTDAASSETSTAKRKTPVAKRQAVAATAKPAPAKVKATTPAGRAAETEKAAPASAGVTRSRRRTAQEPAERAPATGKAKSQPQAAPASAREATKPVAKPPGGQLPLVPPPEATTKDATAAPTQGRRPPRGRSTKDAVPPTEEVTVKEMRGRTISRADLEKLIRGEISKLPQGSGAPETSQTDPAKPSATHKPAARKREPGSTGGKPGTGSDRSKKPSGKSPGK